MLYAHLCNATQNNIIIYYILCYNQFIIFGNDLKRNSEQIINCSKIIVYIKKYDLNGIFLQCDKR